jgi:hypothetical protein
MPAFLTTLPYITPGCGVLDLFQGRNPGHLPRVDSFSSIHT